MIPQITEIGFPSYATLHQANISLSEMGSRVITTQVRIDGDITPDFSGWELEFKGERFVLPIRVPQATKDNSTRNGIVDLTFYSWAEDQLKRYFFMSLSEVTTGVAIADQYVASVTMPVEQFVTLFNSVLQYYFGDRIRMDLFQMGQGIYSTNPVIVEINYTHIWDVLTKFYETFSLRWNIEYDSTTSAYVIKVNYPSDAIEDHDFEYGYKGGLLKFERQVQDDGITNILLGRGGEKNLPYRYFKRTDQQNPEWQADPDAVYELRSIYFDRLRDINFRWYVRGWMQNPNRDRTWENQGYTYPTYSSVPAEYQFAYDRGLTDAKFNPVEFVRDTESIAKYGERWGALDDNDDIYPTIQGVERDPIGRVDEVVAVSEILTDDIEAAAAGNATTNSIGGALSVTINMAPHSRADHEFRSENFTVPEGKTANLNLTWLCLVNGASLAGVRVDTDHSDFVAIDANTGQRVSSEGLPAGTYYVSVEVRVYNDLSTTQTVTFGVNSLTATMADSVVEGWKPTFDIWVKNIWDTTKEAGESDAQYAARVWEPILGDRVGNEAKIVFSDGFMALSQDYEFVIVSYPVFDQSKMIGDVPSEWRITLRKSDAEFDATGLYIPNSQSGGKPVAGDHFFFTGIDMPFIYVQWAEQNLNAVKTTELEKLSDISPTWVITLDKVRVHTLEDEDYGTLLADRLSAGCTVRTKDSRFTNGDVLTLYVQTITYNWEEPSDDQPYLVPDINVVLSDKVVSVESSVQKIQGDIEVIRSTYAKTSDIESVVRRVASPLFLKKTGESDSSNSPTTFASKLSSKSFVQGDIGGSGWGHYDDDEGDAVLELDKVVVRKELRVNSLVVNQIAYVGGKQIMSAAAIECNQVVEDANGYTCFFDQKQGSVANLFVVGDIALGQMFDEENAETRYYCAEVTAVGDNYIVLSKTAKDGSGVPQKGDVIVQYGNKTQTSRQYVIIRDVIGGGYERMLSGLNSVTATGDEYYYAGRQSGQTPRWFVGNASGEHAEYQNGQLNIVGRLSVRKSDGTYQSMSDYIDTVNSVTQNLQNQIDGQIQSWAGDVAPLPDEDGGTANYPANAWSDDATRLKHMGDIYVNNTTGQGYRYTRAANDGDFYWVRITDEEVAEAITKANQALTQIQGYQYLKTALADGSTIVEGGLVLTNLIQLGKEESGQFQVYSGINGLMDTTAKGNGIAAWYGGPMGDKEDGAVSWAKSLFRFDGSGYLASGNIGWNADGSGHIPGITWNGNNITIAGDVQLGSVSGDTVTSMINLLRQINEWFGEDSDGNIYVKSNKGFYSNSFISAFGQSDTGGGGGGGLIARVYGTSGFGGTYSDTDYTNTFNAYAINTLYDRIVALEGASVNISVNVTGSGNAVTTGSYNNGVITLTKGATFLTSVAFADLTAHPTTLAEYGITDAKIQNGVITLGGNTITPMTSIGAGTVTNAMLANSAITINGTSTSLGGSFATADITAGTAGTSSATSGLSIAIPYVTLNKYGIVTAYGTHTHSISKANITSAIGSTTYAPYNSAGYLPLSGGTMTGDIKMTAGKYITTADGSTIIGVTAQGVFYIGEPQGEWSTNIAGAGDLLHDTGGSLAVILDQENFDTYALPLAGGVMTGPISGTTYLSINRAAQTSYRLYVNGTSYLAGNTSVTGTLTVGTSSSNKATTLNGTLSVTGTSTLMGLLTAAAGVKLSTTKKIWFGDNAFIELDSNGYLHTNVGLCSDSFISAFGASDTGGGGGGIDLSAMWANLQVNESGTTGYNLQINPGHLTTALGTYVNAITTTGSGNAITAVSKDGSALTFTKGSTFALASSLANYVTLNSAQTISAVKTFSAGLALNTATSWTSSDRALYFADGSNNSILRYYNVNSNTGLTYNPNTGALKAGSFVKRGGTSSQFLKADGSVDSSVYLTTATAANTYLPLSGGTIAGVTTMPKLRITTKHSSSSTSGGIYYYNGSTDYLLIGQGTSNLWIGANETAGTHHTGSTYISGGDGSVYFSRLVSSTRTNYLALDAGNYSSYALPLSGGTMSGNIVFAKSGSTTDGFPILALSSITGGWDRKLYEMHYDGTRMFHIGAYGNASTFSYAYLGSNGYNGDNLRIYPDKVQFGNNVIWHAGNDGASSGLDADLLDGQHGSYYATAAQLTNGSVTKVGTATVGGTAKPIYLNAGTPAALSATVGSSKMPVYLNAGTISEISSFPEAYLSWGGRNFSGGYGPIDAAMVGNLGACRTMFAKAAGISIEYSTDSGETWEDYGATDSQKITLFSDGSTAFTIGKNSTAGGGGSEKMLRVTLLTKVASVYTTLNKAVIFINTNGSSGCYCTIRARLQSNYENEVDTWTTFIDKAPIAGWTGYNVLNFSSFSTYGNNKSSQYGQIQFIFGCTGSSSGSTPGLSVSKIFCFGGTGWTVPSNMAQNGHIYSWDSDQNTYFPKAVYPPAAGALLGSSSRRWNLYASNGHFSSAVSMTSTLSVAGATTLANLTVGSSNSITLGNGVLTWDATNSAWKLTSNLYATGFISAFGVSSTSDARLKKDFLDTALTVDDIAHAPAITFLWKDREGKRQAGSLAQYWETVLPEVVTDIEGKKGLDYGAAALVSAITIARDVNDHEKRIRELERENRELKRRLGYAME